MLSQLHYSCYAEWRYIARRYGDCRGATLIDALSSVYTGEKTLHVAAVTSDGNLKRWEDFY